MSAIQNQSCIPEVMTLIKYLTTLTRLAQAMATEAAGGAGGTALVMMRTMFCHCVNLALDLMVSLQTTAEQPDLAAQFVLT
jgi:hypothetical protein